MTLPAKAPQGIPPILADAQDVYRKYDRPEDLTGGLPMNLDSLRDGPPGSKPLYPFSTLIRFFSRSMSIPKLTSATLKHCFRYTVSIFPDRLQTVEGTLNSIRHSLSLNPCFEKTARPLADPGKGPYWTVNDKVYPRASTGVHRRKKKSQCAKRRTSEYDDDGSFEESHYTQPQAHGDDPSRRVPHSLNARDDEAEDSSNLGTAHWKAVQHLLAYFKGTLDRNLTYRGGGDPSHWMDGCGLCGRLGYPLLDVGEAFMMSGGLATPS
ncbi:hypothetical protein B0H13DRAFT_1850186 [Mycena leptocephala]|nr:hypothetical protein B0H13DRAFT_1850186 [Mycena leptocephala]